MYDDISPTTQGIFTTVLPCLEPIFVVEVVQRFPVVEGLITVLYWSNVCGKDV
jgi:hypothetical protein